MYAKVFTQIFDSSLAENWQARHVFEDLLKLADRRGIVDMTPESIARRTNVPLDVVVSALAELAKPDPKSRTKARGGRRIVLINARRAWGWLIVNFRSYHAIKDEDARRDYMRLYMRARRRVCKQPVNSGKPGKAGLAHEDVDEDEHEDMNCESSEPPRTDGSGSPLESSSSSSTSPVESRPAERRIGPEMIKPLTASLAMMLGLDKQPRTGRQAGADRTTLEKIAGHIIRGSVGQPKAAIEHWLVRARKIKAEKKVRKPVAMFVFEFREKLDDAKIRWEAAG